MSFEQKRVSRSVLLAGLLAVMGLLYAGCEGDDGVDWDYGTNDPNLYVAVGDSITAGGYPSYLSAMIGKSVLDYGRSGYTAGEAVSVARSALSKNPGTMLILLGANDCIQGVDSGTTVDRIRTIVQESKAHMTRPVVANVMPMTESHAAFDGRVDRLNPLIETMASEEGITLVDLHSIFVADPSLVLSDGLHTGAAGDTAIAQAFADAL